MDTKEKEPYEAPTILVVEIKTEGIICQSGLNKPGSYPGGIDIYAGSSNWGQSVRLVRDVN